MVGQCVLLNVWHVRRHGAVVASLSECLNYLMLITQEELAARVAEQQAAVMAAGLLDKKESEDSAVIGPSMPEHEPPHTEVH